MELLEKERKSQLQLIDDAYKVLYAVCGVSLPILNYNPYNLPIVCLLYEELTLRKVMGHKDYKLIEDTFDIRIPYSFYDIESKNLTIKMNKKNSNKNYIDNLCLNENTSYINYIKFIDEEENFYVLNLNVKRGSLLDKVMTNIKLTGNPNMNLIDLVMSHNLFSNEIKETSRRYEIMAAKLDLSQSVTLTNYPEYTKDAIKRFIKTYNPSYMRLDENEKFVFDARVKFNIYKHLYFTPLSVQQAVKNKRPNLETNQMLINIFKFFINDLDADIKFNVYDLFVGKYLKKEC
jgi:hypothetical protein